MTITPHRNLSLSLAVGVCLLAAIPSGVVAIDSSSHSAAFEGASAGDKRIVAGTPLRWCPAGKFTMGSPPDEPSRRDDEAQVEVTLSHGFWIGRNEVTQEEWTQVMGELPGKVQKEGKIYALHSVSYLEAEAFCRKLTDLARASGELPAEWEFRLPTEAEWEYACRAGTTTATAFGNSLSRHEANFQGEPYNGGEDGPRLEKNARVGSYPPNDWGIHDMHGNQFEWCRDWYHAELPGGEDPDLLAVQGTANRDGTFSRVRRGGAWIEDGWVCRSACRIRYEPDRRSDHIGFRLMAARIQ